MNTLKKENLLFILFPGFGDHKNVWKIKPKGYTKSIYDIFQSYGKVYTFTPKIYNINYYNNNLKKNIRENYSSNINFNNNDISITHVCEEIYNEVKDFKGKFVTVGHSMGGLYCYIFNKLYSERCALNIILDGTLVSIGAKEQIKDKFFKDIFNKYKNVRITNKYLKKYQDNISKDDKNSQKNINEMYDIISYKLFKQRKDKLSSLKELPTPTINFRNITVKETLTNNKYDKNELNDLIEFSNLGILESKYLQEYNNNKYLNIYLVNIGHYIYLNKHGLNKIENILNIVFL